MLVCFFLVQIVFDFIYLDPKDLFVGKGEIMQMGENSKLWLEILEKMIGLRLRNAMLLNAILISAMFERKGS